MWLQLIALLLSGANALRTGPVVPQRPRVTLASPARTTALPRRAIGPAADRAVADALLVLGAVAFVGVEPAAATSGAAWIGPTQAVLQPTFSIFTILFLFRVVLSWFPKYDLNVLPWNIAAWPTEPVLKPTRKFIPPVAGVDISPLVWVAILSFLSEVLTGPQGLLSILQKSS